MVYIASDGTVHENMPWGFKRLANIFNGAISFVILFFQTLVGFDGSSNYRKVQAGGSSYRGSGGGGGGGGGSGGGRPFGPGGGGPSKRIMTMRDVNPPTVGGCAGGACGR